MKDDATVRLLVVAPDRERASSVASGVAGADGADERFEVRSATTDGALEELAVFDADCVASDVGSNAFYETLAAERPDLPVVLFYERERSSEESSATTASGEHVADVVRFGSVAHADDLLASVESAVEPRAGAWYRSLLDATTDVVAVLDEGGEIRYVNETAEPVLGYRPADLVGRSAFEFIHEDDSEAAAELFGRFTEEGPEEFPSARFRFRHADGHWCHVESNGRAPFDSDLIDGSVVCIQDITERLEREQELVRYQTIVETAPVGLFVLDEDGVITWANADYQETLGIPRDELVGTSFLELVEEGYYDPDVPERYVDDVRTLLSGENDVEEVAYSVETHLNGNERRVHDAHITLLPLEDGEFRGTVVAYRDVTKQQTYEAELERQNERLDRFASTVSHDLRNPLSVAMGRVQLAQETGELEHLDHVEGAHERIESLVGGLLALARDDETVDARPVALGDAARTAWESIDHGIATLEVDDDVSVVADPSRLRQALENLCRNAVEHGAEGDEPLAVAVGALEYREGFYVADDGRGVAREDRDRIFEYGYTTVESGTGFGLGIVETVAEDHGWTVTLADGDGGARFEVETGGERGDDEAAEE